MTRQQIMHVGFLVSTFFIAVMSAFSASANTVINFSGNLIVPECTINNGSAISVVFPDTEIQTLSVARQPYLWQTLTIPVNCPYTVGTPTLTVTAQVASGAQAGDGAIMTSKDSEGLAVFLYQDGQQNPIVIGSPNDVSTSLSGSASNMNLTLNTGIGQLNGIEQLTAGNFTSTASLSLVYP